MYSIVFAGEYFFPEPNQYLRFGYSDKFVHPGRLYDWDGTPLWHHYESKEGTSRHYTNVFNVFTVMQIFNLINSRKINDEKNVFEGLFKGPIFLTVLIGICIAQVIIV